MSALGKAIQESLLKLGSPSPLTDGELLGCFVAQHEEAAFQELVRRHGPMVLRVCQRMLRHAQDAEDAFQATFIVLARRAGSIAKLESVGSWLHGVALRVGRQSRARVSRQDSNVRPMDARALEGKHPGHSQSEMSSSDLRSVLDEQVQQLPEKYRAAVVLHYLEGKSCEEVARQLRCQVSAVHKRLERARDRLRGRLERRVVALSATTLSALLVQETASAGLPGPLLATTVAAAAGSAAAVPVSPAALALAGEFLENTAWQRLLVVSVLIFGGLVAAWGLFRATDPTRSQPDAAAPSLHAIFRGHTETILSAAFAPNSQVVATGSADGTVRLWEVATQKELSNHPMNGWAHDLKFSPDGKLVAAASGFQTVCIWETSSGKQRALRVTYDGLHEIPGCYSLAFTQDGTGLAGAVCLADIRGISRLEVQVWDVATLARQSTFACAERLRPRQLSYSADGRSLMVFCDGPAGLRRWDLATHRLLPTSAAVTQTSEPVAADACSPDGQTLVTSHRDGKLRLWKGQGATQPLVLGGGSGRPGEGYPAFSPDSRWLVSVDGGVIRLWEVATGKKLLVLPRESRPQISVLTFSPDARKLCLGCSDGTVEVWSLPPELR